MLSKRVVSLNADRAISSRHEMGVAIFGEGCTAQRFFLLLDTAIRVVKITTEGSFAGEYEILR